MAGPRCIQVALAGGLLVSVMAACERRQGEESPPAGATASASSGTGAPAARDSTNPVGDTSPPPGAPVRPRPRQNPARDTAVRRTPPPAAEPRTTAATVDTVRGTVRVVGSSPMTRVVLSRAAGGPALALSGADTATLRRLAGLEVEARGRLEGAAGFRLSDFTVRALDGEPVIDGVLAREGDALVLRTGSGSVRLGNPPAALSQLIGARVWVGGPPATGPNPYGVITPAP